MKKIIQSLLLSLVCVTLASVSAFADSIKVGFNVPLTGFAAADGNSALHWV